MTLGGLFSDFIDDDPTAGMDYKAVVPGITAVNGWDALIEALTKYCRAKPYGSFGRLRDPSGVDFMTLVSDWIPAHATFMQHGPGVFNEEIFNFFSEIVLSDTSELDSHELSPRADTVNGMPVLVVGVSSYSPLEAEYEPVAPKFRYHLAAEAFKTMLQFERT